MKKIFLLMAALVVLPEPSRKATRRPAVRASPRATAIRVLSPILDSFCIGNVFPIGSESIIVRLLC